MSEQARRAARGRPPLRLEWARWSRAALPYLLPPLVAGAIAAAAWELWVELDHVSEFIMPPPSAVADALFSDLGFFAREGLRTFTVAIAGLAIGAGAAILLAIAMAHSTTLEHALLPIAIAVKVTPIVALAPLFIIWFGFGWEPKVAIAALITYFPVLINGIAGFRDVDSGALDFLRSLHASPREIFLRLRWPSSLPYLFAALKIAATLSLIGAVVAEFFAAGQGGLGSVIDEENRLVRLDRLFAAVVVLATIGVLMNVALSLAERRLLSWHRSTRTAAG
jgi:NitT/TauT family transport system permease protein